VERHISVARTARYQQLGEASLATRQLWVVLHGYGQLAEYFIRHFRPLHAADPAGTVIVAPEGLSRFYLQGTDGRIGASWMTRADRLGEIADHIGYLTQLLSSLLAACPTTTCVTVLGFSQGTATASRWLASYAGHWRPHRLILWAGNFPSDIGLASCRQLIQGLPIAVVSGDQDAYISPAELQAQANALRQYGADLTMHSFSGGHTLDAALLRQLHPTAAAS
jgi:predicted esterase